MAPREHMDAILEHTLFVIVGGNGDLILSNGVNLMAVAPYTAHASIELLTTLQALSVISKAQRFPDYALLNSLGFFAFVNTHSEGIQLGF